MEKEAVREKVPSKEAVKKKKTAVGAAVLGFALIGVISVIIGIVNLTLSIFDDSKTKAKFESFISPVVMVDPVAFEGVDSADEHVLLMSSMWKLLTDVGEDAYYNEDEYGMMQIPASDLDVSAAELFGSKASLSHQTFGNSNINFEYNSETSCYTVPPMGYTVQYQPRVDKIKKKGKTYTLTVSYVSTNTTLAKNDSEETAADKVMYYVLEKTGKNKYIILSVLDAPSSGSKKQDSASEAASTEKPVSSAASSSASSALPAASK